MRRAVVNEPLAAFADSGDELAFERVVAKFARLVSDRDPGAARQWAESIRHESLREVVLGELDR